MSKDISINVNLNFEEIHCGTVIPIVRLFREDADEIFCGAEQVYIGTGFASGEDKEIKAAHVAAENPFMAMSIKETLKVLIIFTVLTDNEFDGIEAAVNSIIDAVHPDAKILFGLYLNETMEYDVRVDIIAAK
ncbi:MAG: hypothetical protein FWE83_05410 [Oscillospiraceae bacterium]|nr:hypothetical protein [Oscillospiraceae bacterium]